MKKNTSIVKPNNELRPTKKNIKRLLYSSIQTMTNLYIIELFAGTGDISLNLFFTTAKKIILIEKDIITYKNIINIKQKLTLNNNLITINCDSYIFLKKLYFLNISFIIFDPPYNKNNIKEQLIYLNKIIFIKKYLLLFIETNKIITFKEILTHTFIIKKCQKGQTIFYLIKKI